jgi:hypothetical protein
VVGNYLLNIMLFVEKAEAEAEAKAKAKAG